ncbi:flagellum-specific ATP synthase FliI, partial [Bacillus licheniformis]|nr:flagellum-specific ATP synthase FliI [Bacillus licheniformis]
GAYKKGSSREIDEAIQFHPKLISFLKQEVDEAASLEESISLLKSLTGRED